MAKRVVLIVMMTTALLASPASAQTYPPDADPSVAVTPSTVPAGQEISVSVDGFTPDATVDISFNPDLGSIEVDGDGAGSATFVVPGDQAPGDYTLLATDGTLSATATLTVTDGAVAGAGLTNSGDVAAASAGAGLPLTGAGNSIGLAQIGAAVLALGATLTFLARRRRSI